MRSFFSEKIAKLHLYSAHYKYDLWLKYCNENKIRFCWNKCILCKQGLLSFGAMITYKKRPKQASRSARPQEILCFGVRELMEANNLQLQ